jgi:actin-related protein
MNGWKLEIVFFKIYKLIIYFKMSEEIANINTSINKTIIIENSSGFIRVGFSGEKYPRFEIPAIVGRPKSQGVQMGYLLEAKQQVFVGDEALNYTSNTLTLQNPIKNGIVTNWDHK